MSTTKKSRCAVCQRKVGMDYYVCKCANDLKFCATHRYPFSHNCTVNKSREHKEILVTQNPRIVPDKFAHSI